MFLQVRHWRVSRNHVGRLRSPDGKRWIRVGEVGHADWTAVWPVPRSGKDKMLGLPNQGWCHLIYIEIKATGKHPSAAQETWLAARKQEGYLAGWWDSLQQFEEWYEWQMHTLRVVAG